MMSEPFHFAGNAFFAAQSGSPVLKAMIDHILGYSNPQVVRCLVIVYLYPLLFHIYEMSL